MNTFFCCPKCGEELEVRTTTDTTDKCNNCGVALNGKRHRPTHLGICEITDDVPVQMSKEFIEFRSGR